MKVYSGRRIAGTCEVTVDGVPLDPRLDLRVFSAAGFEWGYDGAGPRQLALAIVADHFADVQVALGQHDRFRLNFVVAMRDDSWSLTSREVERALNEVIEVPMTLEELFDKVRGRPR
ncbi:MAG TPA: DUF6166 domain-containing protein [Alphaproteobacteria bacterium]